MTNTTGREAKTINAAFDETGITFHDRAAALSELTGGHEVVFDEDGSAHTKYDGEILPLQDALTRFAYDRRDQIDGRTLPRNGAGSARPGIDSKANYTTAGDKARFIGEHGLDAWERLPLAGLSSSEIISQDDWRKLPVAEKVRRLRADPDAFTKLPRSRARLPHEPFINEEALARELRARGR